MSFDDFAGAAGLRWERAAFAISVVYLWVTMILLGAVVLETFMIYPNIFVDPPASLETALAFMRVSGPSDFFPPLGFVSWVTGVAAALLAWRVKGARWWVLGSVALMLADGLFSMLFHWPRNTILFVEGAAMHPAELLRATAVEFQRLHWSRLVFTAGAALTMFVGLLRLHRHRLLRWWSSRSAAAI